MEVAMAMESHNKDFEFSSALPSPYASAPSTPPRIGQCYFSAPASPKRLSEFYRQLDDFLITNSGSSTSTRPKSSQVNTKYEADFDFAFDVSKELGRRPSLSAEELFDDGMIRPQQLPPRAKSPRPKKPVDRNTNKKGTERERGRERIPSSLSSAGSSSSRKGTRSLSPLRVPQDSWEESSSSSSKGNRKWRLKDFFLFRSASEGRASDGSDPLRKYAAFFKRNEDAKSSSLRAMEGFPGSGSGSVRRGRVSAHELHYTKNRAVSEEMKKKTFLPYKQGILGRLAFNPAVNALANGFGFSRK